jgi:hypothetical protein
MLFALELGLPRGAWRVMLLRRVSGRPGAEGAPLVGWGAVMLEVKFRPVLLSVWEAWFDDGVKRRDWLMLVCLV